LLQRRKEVKKNMKRIIKVLVVSALMVVLMATTVSPAFARPYHHDDDSTGQKKGWKHDGLNGGCEYGPTPTSTDNGEGWGAGYCTEVNYKR
jgi:hypothetical protein